MLEVAEKLAGVSPRIAVFDKMCGIIKVVFRLTDYAALLSK